MAGAGPIRSLGTKSHAESSMPPSAGKPTTVFSNTTPSSHQTERTRPRHVERVRISAVHHPLFGQLVTVVRCMRDGGELHLVIESLDGGRQLLPARHAEPAGAAPPVVAASALVFTPGSLRALADLVATLRRAPSLAPEARHAPRSKPAPPAIAAVERLPARDAPAPRPALGRPAAAPAAGRAGVGARARRAVP